MGSHEEELARRERLERYEAEESFEREREERDHIRRKEADLAEEEPS